MTVSASVEVKNKLGIHARPAMMLFELVQGFDAHVLLRNEEGVEADADSVIGLLMLDSAQGKQVEVQVEGPEEVEALAAVVALFTSGCVAVSGEWQTGASIAGVCTKRQYLGCLPGAALSQHEITCLRGISGGMVPATAGQAR